MTLEKKMGYKDSVLSPTEYKKMKIAHQQTKRGKKKRKNKKSGKKKIDHLGKKTTRKIKKTISTFFLQV
jgi:hypothetical protein